MTQTRLSRLCEGFRGALRRALVQIGVSRVLLLGLSVLGVVILADWAFHIPRLMRFLLLLSYLGGLGAAVWWTIWRPMRRSWPDRDVLAYMDAVAPRDQAMLLDLHELLHGDAIEEVEGEVGRRLADEAIEELAPLAEQVAPALALEQQRVRRWMKRAVVTLAVTVALCIPLGRYAAIGCARFFNPFCGVRWPHRTTIAIEERAKGWSVPQLESLTVKGTVTGVRPPQVTLAYRNESSRYWIKEKVAVGDDGAVAYTFPEVRERLRFYVEGGDYKTDVYPVDVIQRPFIRKLVAHYDYPAYAGIPDRAIESGQLSGIEGTSVRLVMDMSMKLDKALFILDGSAPEQLAATGDRQYEKTLLLESNGVYRLELYDAHGYREPKPEIYDIRVIPDESPVVQMLSPGRDLIVTRQATVDIAFRAEDDYGLERVEFLYALNGGDPVVVSGKITGPVRQRGLESEARFAWNLGKMDFPMSGIVNYFVRVKDVNPTGRGVSQSLPFELNLVKPSEFQLAVVEKSKRIDAEARIAWENQLAAWKLAAKWSASGTGKEDDPIWTDMVDRQNLSIRACRAMDMFLRELVDTYEQNDMSREFMSVRLNVIGECASRVSSDLHPLVAKGIQDAAPRTAAEAAPAALQAKRKQACEQFANSQKLALLYLERSLKKLFDWRDLQITSVRATLLDEEQAEVLRLTEAIAPRFLGAEKEDLAEVDVDALITLGKRQSTMFDIETELEEQLVFMKSKAQKQDRKSIQRPLDAAYKVLRDRRVNDDLKQAARFIANNQPYEIIKNQKAAGQALRVVRGGLIVAGQRVDEDEPIMVAMVPTETLGDVILKPDQVASATTEPGTEADQTGESRALTPEEMLAALPMGSDRLSAALSAAMDLEAGTVARTRYLAANSTPAEMPRYVNLKQLIIKDYQKRAAATVMLAVKEAQEVKAAPIERMLGDVLHQCNDSWKMIGKRIIGAHTQQFQTDIRDALRDMVQHVSLQKVVADGVEENQRMGGKDAFGRAYTVRGDDLTKMLAVVDDLAAAALMQGDLLRKAKRWDAHKAKDPDLAAVEKAERERAVALAKEVSSRMKALPTRLTGISTNLEARVAGLGVADAAGFTTPDWASESLAPTTLVAASEQGSGLFAKLIGDIRNMFSERERSAIEREAEAPVEVVEMTKEDFERLTSNDYLREKIMAETGLPDEIRERMLKGLSEDFPEKYKALISAYYASFVMKETKPK
jgi:hypothetical protein